MNFVQVFERYLRKECKIKPDDRILVAVSGGADSMCLLHLLHRTQNQIAIVHCNFQLRGAESDEDESFVQQWAEKLAIPYFSKKFNTKEYANINRISIQEAARELRYNYFENIRRQNHYHYIATAHHADDNIETIFINLIRGTGLKGITGIKWVNDKLIRPLLFAYRSDIERYCVENQIPFRTDSSNLSDKYLRNQIRHHIIPALEKLNPSFRKTMLQNISYFQQAEKVYQLFAEQLKSLIETRNDGVMAIPIEKIRQHPSPELALFELLQPFGFSPETCNNIYQSIEAEPGKLFISKTHRLIKDRAYWLIEKIENDYPGEVYYIDENSNGIDQPIKLSFRRYRAHEYIIKKHSQVAALDADKIQFPLILRHWHAGDYFIPLGMNNFKKLSDFFIDLKLSRIHKSRIWILANGKDIVWVVGHRIDERYKITSQTNNVLEIIWEE